ncbi:MAG: leucyl aminopeptidase [Phycisphaerae bacterium]|nr:leucyl aminopeptidase [Phycisphaerae bacterium]
MADGRLQIRLRRLTRDVRADALLIPVRAKDGRADRAELRELEPLVGERLAELCDGSRGLSEVGAIDGHLLAARHRWKRIALVSLGSAARPMPDQVRRAAGTAVQWCARHQVRHALVACDALSRRSHDGGVLAAWIEGAALGGYRYVRFKNRPNSRPPERMTLASRRATSVRLRAAVERAVCAADSVNLARDLGHDPPNVAHPEGFARRAAGLARRYGLRCRVLGERQLAERKMNALLAVGAGSVHRPRLIVIEYRGRRSRRRPIVLIGKAVTHDSGGYSIKPAASMPDMKYDKCGGTAVLAALVAAARLKLPAHVVGVIPTAENLISGHAYRNGDILRAMNGKTIEVVNTDAEGRLILADAMTYAQRTFRPAVMVDIATLTAACSVALGAHAAGLFSNDDALADALLACGRRTGDRCWRLPLWDEYRAQIEGGDADIKNSGGQPAGAITAAMFLREFVEGDVPWAHVDIAGVATTDRDDALGPRGATGFGVRLLIEYIRSHG